MLTEKLKLSDFKFYHLENDRILNLDLERKGLRFGNLPTLSGENNKDFAFKYDNVEVGLVYLKKLLNNLPKEEQNNIILGIENFKLDMFFNYLNRLEIFEKLDNNWQHFAKRCQWNYILLIKIEDKIYIIENDIETRLQYPEKRDEEDLFQLIIFANSEKHFVHLNELSEEEKTKIPPKAEVFRRLQNYFINNFYNCICLNLKDI